MGLRPTPKGFATPIKSLGPQPFFLRPRVVTQLRPELDSSSALSSTARVRSFFPLSTSPIAYNAPFVTNRRHVPRLGRYVVIKTQHSTRRVYADYTGCLKIITHSRRVSPAASVPYSSDPRSIVVKALSAEGSGVGKEYKFAERSHTYYIIILCILGIVVLFVPILRRTDPGRVSRMGNNPPRLPIDATTRWGSTSEYHRRGRDIRTTDTDLGCCFSL